MTTSSSAYTGAWRRGTPNGRSKTMAAVSQHARDDARSPHRRSREALSWVGRQLAEEAWFEALRSRREDEDRRADPSAPPGAAA